MTDFPGAANNSSDFDGNTLLLEVEDRRYVYISGQEITESETSDKVIDCISLVGNNMVPYAIILGEKRHISCTIVTSLLKTMKLKKALY